MALSEKIIEVLNDYALTRKMMYNNLYKISEYTIEKWRNNIWKYLNRLSVEKDEDSLCVLFMQ
mgnify:CR=1 FL=1